MSKLITIRLPDELLESVDAMAKAEGMNRSQAIIALLRDGDLSPVVAVEPPRSGVVVAESKKPEPKEEKAREWKPCPKHGVEAGFPRSDGWWCSKCGKMYRE